MSQPRAPRKHHYLPEFYLSQWTSEDRQLERFSLEQRGQIYHRRAFPSQVGFVENLYKLPGNYSDEWQAQKVETDFFSNVDNLAAQALQFMLRTGVAPPSSEERTAWITFILSLLHRTPQHLDATLEAVRQANEELMPEIEQRYEALRSPRDPLTFHEWEKQRAPYAVDLSGFRAMMEVIANPSSGSFLVNLKWAIIDLSSADYDLLTSDSPVILVALKTNDGHLALPISPRKLFLAAQHDHVISGIAPARTKEIVRIVNRLIVERAVRYVIAKDTRQKSFIQKYFGTCQIGSIATGFVQPKRTL